MRENDLIKITGAEDMIIEHALGFAVSLMRSYLVDRYDTQALFSAEGENREGLLVALGVDIAIYEIVAIAQPNIDLTDRRERRRQAIEYLTGVRDNNLPTGWPLRQEEPEENPSVLHGGIPPRGNYY